MGIYVYYLGMDLVLSVMRFWRLFQGLLFLWQQRVQSQKKNTSWQLIPSSGILRFVFFTIHLFLCYHYYCFILISWQVYIYLEIYAIYIICFALHHVIIYLYYLSFFLKGNSKNQRPPISFELPVSLPFPENGRNLLLKFTIILQLWH